MKNMKRVSESNAEQSPSPKVKRTEAKFEVHVKPKKFSKPIKSKKFQKEDRKTPFNKKPNFDKNKKFIKPDEKPTDWNEFKKKKKEVREKRKQSKNLYEVIAKAKQIGEKLRVKKLEGGNDERNKLVNELHELLGNQGSYVKFVLAHDMARIVQYMLKFGSPKIRQDISNEIIPATVQMLQSKYGKFCVKRMLKYGNSPIRSDCIKAFYGNAVKLTSHAISAPVFEYAYSTWASQADKINLIQEFFGDMYKQSKDKSIRHLRDIYKESSNMKAAVLSSTKANLSRILNKDLLDSGLVQSVLHQFLTECSNEDRAELISQLAPHIVVISNSRDGARVAMQCIWHGTNKERKILMKALKEHVIELCKHEHAHCALIALLDAADDTVLLHKIILGEILEKTEDLVIDDWGRKVLLWLASPADKTHFHPQFINELESGRTNSTCKKDAAVRREELLAYSSKVFLEKIKTEPKMWLEQPSRAVVTLAILKSGTGNELQESLKSIAVTIVASDWKLKDGENEVAAVENAGIHMTLKKLAQNDKKLAELGERTFGQIVVDLLSDETIKIWIKLNRGCFLLLSLFENNTEQVQNNLRNKLKNHIKLIQKQKSAGSKILLDKIQK